MVIAFLFSLIVHDNKMRENKRQYYNNECMLVGSTPVIVEKTRGPDENWTRKSFKCPDGLIHSYDEDEMGMIKFRGDQ